MKLGSTVPVLFKGTGPQKLTVALIYGDADTAGVREQRAGDLAFPDLRIGQAPGRRHPVRDVPVACLWLAAFTLWVVVYDAAARL